MPIKTGHIAPEYYKLNKIVLSADRYDNDEFIITSQVSEFNIYESLLHPYLRATMSLLDDNNIYSEIGIGGTERITISMDLDVEENTVIEKSFIITEVVSRIKVNNNANMLVLALIEEHGFTSKIDSFSKSYTGKPEQIVQKIIEDRLKKSVIGTDIQSAQSSLKYIVPYYTTEQAIERVLERATTSVGNPYFCFATIYDDNIRILDMNTILESDPINQEQDLHFVYSEAWTQTNSNNFKDTLTRVYNINIQNQDNIMFLAINGAVSSDYLSIDGDNATGSKYNHRFSSTFENLKKSENFSKSLLDNKLILSGKNLESLKGKSFSDVSFKTYNDYDNIHTDKNRSNSLLWLRRQSILDFLSKNQIDFVMPGAMFSSEGYKVGCKFIFETANSQPLETTSIDGYKDKKVSGEYIMVEKRHIFKETSHIVAFKGVKIANSNEAKI